MRPLSVVISLLVAVTVLTAVSAAAGPLPPGGSFLDDDGNVHEGNIEAIAALAITRGCNPPANDRFCPAATVTRGQMAAFLVRALSLTDDGGGTWFTDIDGSIFETDINRLRTAEITLGCNPPANTSYCPDGIVTRGQMAAFLVRAFGYTDPGMGNWFTDDDDSIFEANIDRLRVAGVTLGCNPPANDNFCPTSPVTRAQMATFLTRALGLTPMVPPPRPDLALESVVVGLDSPIYVTAPPGDDRLFIVEKNGTIRILEDGALLPGFFLDVRADTYTSGDAGLLSLAFHPDYAANGRFFVYQSQANAATPFTSHIYEYAVSGDPDDADESSRIEILALDQRATNHNGGQIEFGPDRNLWIGFGDEGRQDDEFGNGQNLDTWHSSMLRINVDGAAPYVVPADNPFVGAPGLDEIWAYGLRNPWRWDIYDGNIYIADVGQDAREEVNVVPIDEPGHNFGWCDWEGTLAHSGDNCGNVGGTTFPDIELFHSDGNCSITGGRVYEGTALPHLVGHYFYVDFCRGHLSSFELVAGVVTNQRDWTDDVGTVPFVWSFGSDAAGEVYIVLGGSGEILRLAAS